MVCSIPIVSSHSENRDPQTNPKDVNMYCGFLCNNPELVNNIMFVFSDRERPVIYRHMYGYSAHQYKWINENGDWHYVQIHMLTDQGVKNFNNKEAHSMTANNPDYAGQDLTEAIEKGEYPSWTC